MSLKDEIVFYNNDIRISIGRYTLGISFCSLPLAHERTIYEFPIDLGMYGTVLFIKWNLGSWEL